MGRRPAPKPVRDGWATQERCKTATYQPDFTALTCGVGGGRGYVGGGRGYFAAKPVSECYFGESPTGEIYGI